jgi:hypothetical protein
MTLILPIPEAGAKIQEEPSGSFNEASTECSESPGNLMIGKNPIRMGETGAYLFMMAGFNTSIYRQRRVVMAKYQ